MRQHLKCSVNGAGCCWRLRFFDFQPRWSGLVRRIPLRQFPQGPIPCRPTGIRFLRRQIGLWVPGERAFQLSDASFLCEYLRLMGRLLEDGHFNEAKREALAWKPYLNKAKDD